MIYGYARVSLDTQCLDLQIDALAKAGCESVFAEKISGVKKERNELEKLRQKLKKGDTLICYKLDRLGRSLHELLNFMTDFEKNHIRFISISDGIDTAKSGSKLLLNIMMCIADFEREMIRERTIAGLEAARRRGVQLGRPKGLSPKYESLKSQVLQLHSLGKNPTTIKSMLNISRPTIYKYISS